jgi:hypothetical protein
VLADDEGRELGEILVEIDADLARQEAEIRVRRERLAALLRREDLDVDDTVSPPTAELLDRINAAFPDSATVRHDREFLALIDREDVSEGTSVLCRAAFDHPEQRVRIATLYRRFEAGTWHVKHPVIDPNGTSLRSSQH